jgi:hypothetical protein
MTAKRTERVAPGDDADGNSRGILQRKGMTPLRIERLCLVTICVLTGALIGSNGVYAQSPVVPDGDTIQAVPRDSIVRSRLV